MKKVYVAAPYTKGDVAVNVANAIKAGNDLMELGFTPYVPHLSHFQHMLYPRPYKFWLAYDIEWLDSCDALLRLEGESHGADQEVEYATNNGIPVYYSISELVKKEL